MTDTLEVQISLSNIWDFLRTRVLDKDVGPYPKEQIVIGVGVSKRKPGSVVEISRLDALAACVAWKAFVDGNRKAIQDPRFGHVVEILGYVAGLRSGLEFVEASRFGEWLAYTISGWSDGQDTTGSIQRLERIAKKAAFRPAVKAVLHALEGGKVSTRVEKTCAVA